MQVTDTSLQSLPQTQSAEQWPFVSVIIPVYNDGERLALCLEALERQSYPADRYEVIVVDNGSRESIEPIAGRFEHATATFEGSPGSYVARNRGLEIARGEVLAFTDSDCVPHPDWVQGGVRKLQEPPGYGLAGGRIDISFADEARPNPIEFYDSLWGFPQEVYVLRDRCTVTANLIARREAFEAAGPFDKRLKSGGDREWCGRAIAAGFDIAYADEAAVSHPARRTLEELSNKTRRVSGGRFDRLKHRSRNHAMEEAKEILWEMRPPFRAIGRIWRNPRIPDFDTRVRVLGVVLYVRYLTAFERIRLLCGGKSRR